MSDKFAVSECNILQALTEKGAKCQEMGLNSFLAQVQDNQVAKPAIVPDVKMGGLV